MYHGRNAEADRLAARQTPITPAGLPKVQGGSASAATALYPAGGVDSIKWRFDQLGHTQIIFKPVDSDEVLFDRLVELKLASADFSVHLDQAWRAGMFKKLDNLLDVDEWDFSDEMPSVASFKTFLRMIIHNKVSKRPSLGATADGKIIGSWRDGEDRLVVECLPNDHVRWVGSRRIHGERISAAGTSPVSFLRTALQPYAPEIWFG